MVRKTHYALQECFSSCEPLMCYRTGIKGIFEPEGVVDCAFLVVVVRFSAVGTFCCFPSSEWVKGGAEGRCWELSFGVGFGGLHPEFSVESVQLLHGFSLRTVISTETLRLNI